METKNKEMVALNYMKNFSCIGAACEDTCCAGWYIAIDEATYKKYQKVKDKAMRKRLDKELVAKKSSAAPDHVAKIKLKNGRCAFLSKEGWCDIYTQLGEKYLSQTCTLYPRTINCINSTLEYSLTFSCPEAVRTILLRQEPIQFEKLEKVSETLSVSATILADAHKPKKWQDYFLTLREFIVELLQMRSYTLEERLNLLEKAVAEVDCLVAKGNLKKVPVYINTFKAQVSKKQGAKSIEPRVTEPKESLSEEIAIAKKLIETIKCLEEDKKFPSERYKECFEEVLRGFGVENEIVQKAFSQKYEEAYHTYYLPFMNEKGYMLENYLVNYVFERCIPLDGQTPLESFERMYRYYTLIKLHLIGMAAYHKGLKEEHVVKLIQAFSKVFDHNEQYSKTVINKNL